MPYIPRDSKSLIQSMTGRVIARTDLTDLSEGSVLLQILAAFGEELNLSEIRLKKIRDSFFLKNVSGADLDERAAELPPSGLSRAGKSFAQGSVLTVTASSSSTSTNLHILPAGSIFAKVDDPTKQYVTTADVTMPDGSDTLSNVHIKAAEPGPEHNCSKNVITKVVSAPSWVQSVYNEGLQNGSSRETDEQLKNRMVAYLSSLARCQKSALEFVALQYEDENGSRARFAKLHEFPEQRGYSELVIDDGTGFFNDRKVGAKVEGIVPANGQVILYHEYPATSYIEEVKVVSGGTSTIYRHANKDYISIPERGMVYFPPGKLSAGDQWTIGGGDAVASYEVWTNLISNLQRVIEGDPSNPIDLPGWRAAGTRVVVRPADTQPVELDFVVIPEQYISLSEVQEDIIAESISFFKELAPGETFYVSRLIDRLMNNRKIKSLRIYEHDSSNFKADDSPASHYKSLRTDATSIRVLPGPSEV